MLIKTLTLLTPDPKSVTDFYADILGLNRIADEEGIYGLQIGSSKLLFRQAETGWAGRYHFAFNIPENQFAEAKSWLNLRTAILQTSSGQDEFHFEDWNAHSVYFYDPVGNIAELIARHELKNASTETFDSEYILCISEIGLAAEDIPLLVRQVEQVAAVEKYKDSSETFTALGNEEGLFVIVKAGRIWFPETGIPAQILPVQVDVLDEDGTAFNLPFPVS